MKTLVLAAALFFAVGECCKSSHSVSTDNGYNYHNTGVDLSNEDSVVFKVRAGNDAHVALSSSSNLNSNMYELVIGGWRDTKSTIRKSKQGTDLLYSYQGDILNCDEYRYFWLSWEYDTIKLGLGTDVGAGEIMSFADPSAPTINVMSVATGWGSSGSWAVLDCDNEAEPCETDTTISTDNSYHYEDTELQLSKADGVVFRVRACNDAHVALLTSKNLGSNMYEIVLGGWSNSKSTIRKSKQGTDLLYNYQRVLNCNGFTNFWMSWTDKTLRVGLGSTIGSQELMRYVDSNQPAINYMFVATGWGANGEWEIEECPGIEEPTPAPTPAPTEATTKPYVPPTLPPQPEECKLKKDAGDGSRKVSAFYYSTKTGKCKKFKYSGSGGNANRFSTKEECENKCKN